MYSKVKAINIGKCKTITLGKIYKVTWGNKYWLQVICDDGTIRGFKSFRFKNVGDCETCTERKCNSCELNKENL